MLPHGRAVRSGVGETRSGQSEPGRAAPIGLLVIDDRQEVARALAAGFGADLHVRVVGCVAGSQVGRGLDSYRPDIVLLDYSTVVRAGAPLMVAALRAEVPNTPIILRARSRDSETAAICAALARSATSQTICHSRAALRDQACALGRSAVHAR